MKLKNRKHLVGQPVNMKDGIEPKDELKLVIGENPEWDIVFASVIETNADRSAIRIQLDGLIPISKRYQAVSLPELINTYKAAYM